MDGILWKKKQWLPGSGSQHLKSPPRGPKTVILGSEWDSMFWRILGLCRLGTEKGLWLPERGVGKLYSGVGGSTSPSFSIINNYKKHENRITQRFVFLCFENMQMTPARGVKIGLKSTKIRPSGAAWFPPSCTRILMNNYLSRFHPRVLFHWLPHPPPLLSVRLMS